MPVTSPNASAYDTASTIISTNTRPSIGPERRRSRQTSTTPVPTSSAPNTSSPFRPPNRTKTLFSRTSAPFRTPASESCDSVKASTSYATRSGKAKVRL